MSSGKHKISWSEWQPVDREGFRGWYRDKVDNKGRIVDQEWREEESVPRQAEPYSLTQQFGEVSLGGEPYSSSFPEESGYIHTTTSAAPETEYATSPPGAPYKKSRDKSSSSSRSEKHKSSSKDAPSRSKSSSSSKGGPPPKHSSSSSSARSQPEKKHRSSRPRKDEEGDDVDDGDDGDGGDYDEGSRGGEGTTQPFYGKGRTQAPMPAVPEDEPYPTFSPQAGEAPSRPSIEQHGSSYGLYPPTGQGPVYTTDFGGGYGGSPGNTASDPVWRQGGDPLEPRLPSRHRNKQAYQPPVTTEFHTTPGYGEVDDNETDLPQDPYHQTGQYRLAPGAYERPDDEEEYEEPAEEDFERPDDPSKKRHMPRGDKKIKGTNGYYEELDPRYQIAPSHRFQPGEVFKILWSEPQGHGRKAPRGTIASLTERSERGDNYGQKFWVGFRRFIVVATDEGHSTCVPILTYERKACTKKGVKPLKHGIIYASGTEPRLLRKEPQLGFAPVQMNLAVRDEKLADESRINYSKLVTVEHNVKVFFIGSIIGEHLATISDAVDGCWQQKIRKRSKK